MNIVIVNTPESINAAVDFSARSNTCIQDILDIAGFDAYCACSSCSAHWAAEAAAEVWAEGAWLRAAEAGDPCRGMLTPGGCLCC